MLILYLIKDSATNSSVQLDNTMRRCAELNQEGKSFWGSLVNGIWSVVLTMLLK